jgi:DNA-binding NarL/FixJ family response regulator
MLTPLQEDVAALVAQGCSNREIAQRLALTPDAVSNEIAGLFRALGAISRVDIALWALEHGSHR